MNDFTDPSSTPSSIPNISAQEVTSTNGPSVNRVSILPEASTLDSEAQAIPVRATALSQERDIQVIAKTYQPLCGKIVSVIDAIGVRAVSRRAESLHLPKQVVSDFEVKCHMSDETHELITGAGSRIAARHITDPEQMDYIALVGGLAEWGWTITSAIAELKKIALNPSLVQEIPVVEPDKRKR